MGLRDIAEVRVYAYGLEPLTKPTSDSLIVGHATRGKIGAVANNKVRSVLTANSRMYSTDLSCYVTAIDIDRGKKRATESFEAGRMVLELDASDRRFDPLYTAGAYNAGVAKQMFRRGTPIVACVSQLKTSTNTVSTQEFPLFSGWVDKIDFVYSPSGTLFSARVECVDAFTLLARVDLNAADATYGTNERLGARILRWMEVAGLTLSTVATARGSAVQVGPNDRRRYDTVTMPTGSYDLQGTMLQANALTAIKQTAASSDANVWVTAFGDIAWSENHSPTTSGVTFGDTPGAGSTPAMGTETMSLSDTVAPISDVRPILDTEDWANVVQFARDGGTTQTGTATFDDENRAQYNRTDLLNANDTDVATLAAAFATRHGTPPVNVTLTTDPFVSDAAMFYACMFDLTAGVRWQWSAAGLDVDNAAIAGISHQIRPGLQWRATYTITQRL